MLWHFGRVRAGDLRGASVLSQQLIALFLNAESSRLALETGTSCIRFLGWFYILIGLKMATDGVLRGAGTWARLPQQILST